ncbi:MAG: DUF1059 domain-containing protein [Myxococcaceae bacterium]|nr:DUF1059 domain-containing protein [Myxococcaceae bacterium]
MSRKMMDCRKVPNDVGCTLTISGEEQEVYEAAVKHSIDVHHEKDTPELREMVRNSLEDEPSMTTYAEDTSERAMRV